MLERDHAGLVDEATGERRGIELDVEEPLGEVVLPADLVAAIDRRLDLGAGPADQELGAADLANECVKLPLPVPPLPTVPNNEDPTNVSPPRGKPPSDAELPNTCRTS